MAKKKSPQRIIGQPVKPQSKREKAAEDAAYKRRSTPKHVTVRG